MTVDIVIFTIQSEELKVLLVKRGIPPFKGPFALPGGFVHEDESLDEAARRELREETGVSDVYLEQLYSFGQPGRDPRERIITIAYYALISADCSLLAAGSDTEAIWWPVNKLPALAFDHREIFDYALERLRNKLEEARRGFGTAQTHLSSDPAHHCNSGSKENDTERHPGFIEALAVIDYH